GMNPVALLILPSPAGSRQPSPRLLRPHTVGSDHGSNEGEERFYGAGAGPGERGRSRFGRRLSGGLHDGYGFRRLAGPGYAQANGRGPRIGNRAVVRGRPLGLLRAAVRGIGAGLLR